MRSMNAQTVLWPVMHQIHLTVWNCVQGVSVVVVPLSSTPVT